MLSNPTRRFSPATALSVAAILGGTLFAAAPAGAQVPGEAIPSTTTPTPTATPTPTPTPTSTPAPRPAPAGNGSIAIPEDTTPDPPAPPTPVGPQGLLGEAPISLGVLVAKLQESVSVNGGSTGWAYSISRQGQIVGGNAGGLARLPFDANNDADGIPFTQSTRIELMSTTKPITAMAMLKALDAAGISVDAPVGKYLPAGWQKGKGFSKYSVNPITFRHLLTHTSGILQAFQDPNIDHTGWDNEWVGLVPIVKEGATPNVAAGEQYKNANYSLMRVLLPKLWSLTDGPKTAVTEANHGLRYLSYVNTKILAPAGIAATSCNASNPATAAFVYNKSNLGILGRLVDYTGVENQCGGHRGLHLSTLDLVRLTAKLRETNAVLPAHVRKAMFDGRLGWSTFSNRSGTDRAGLWYHGGDGDFSGGRQVNTCVMNAPQGYQLSIIFNSQTPSSTYQCTILKNAINAARTA